MSRSGAPSTAAPSRRPRHRLVGAPARLEGFANIAGLGVQGVVPGAGGAHHAVLAGRAQFLEHWSQHLSPDLARGKAEAEADGRTAVAVGWDGRARAVLVVADTVRPTSS